MTPQFLLKTTTSFISSHWAERSFPSSSHSDSAIFVVSAIECSGYFWSRWKSSPFSLTFLSLRRKPEPSVALVAKRIVTFLSVIVSRVFVLCFLAGKHQSWWKEGAGGLPQLSIEDKVIRVCRRKYLKFVSVVVFSIDFCRELYDFATAWQPQRPTMQFWKFSN